MEIDYNMRTGRRFAPIHAIVNHEKLCVGDSKPNVCAMQLKFMLELDELQEMCCPSVLYFSYYFMFKWSFVELDVVLILVKDDRNSFNG